MIPPTRTEIHPSAPIVTAANPFGKVSTPTPITTEGIKIRISLPVIPSSAYSKRFTIISPSCPLIPYHLFALLLAFLSSMESVHGRSEEHTSELQSRFDLVCRLLLEKKKHHIAQPH